MFACNSGLFEEHKENAEETRMYIFNLCKALFALGYKDLQVSGYIGYTKEKMSGEHSLVASTLKKQAGTMRASDSRITLKCNSEGEVEVVEFPKVDFTVAEYKHPKDKYPFFQVRPDKMKIEEKNKKHKINRSK